MQPQNIDMGVIREAMERRRQGGRTPVAAQQTRPTGPSQMGTTPSPQAPQPQMQSNPNIGQTPGQARQGQPKQVPQAAFDPDIRALSRAMIGKLIQGDAQTPDESKALVKKLTEFI